MSHYSGIINRLKLIIKQVILSLTLISITSQCTNMLNCQHYNDFLKKESLGTVTNKYLDSANHMSPTILLIYHGKKGLENRTGYYLSEVYDTLAIGDQLFKSSGSAKVKVIKKGKEIEFVADKERWCKE